MPLVRILVDGYSLLHSWQQLAPGRPRYSSAAREELIQALQQYRDAMGTPITVVFDGSGPAPNIGIEIPSTPELEIIYSKSGQTADDIIERVAARLVAYGDVLVVTNDFAERDTVLSAGANTLSCEHFVQMLQAGVAELQRDVQRYNRSETERFRKRK